MLIKYDKKQIILQAIERTITNDNWITLVILFVIILLAIMKLIKPNKLLGYALAFFTPGFFQKKVQNNVSIYSPFHLLLFSFSSIVISLFLFFVFTPKIYDQSFLNYLILLSIISLYFFIRRLLDFTFSNILGLSLVTKYFLYTKSGYLYTLSLWLFPAIILYQYAFKENLYLLSFFLILFAFRGFLILLNNKRLVISKLFYFILYFCVLEIAPLLILYKTTTTT
ncbi:MULTISPECIES: DUF4271 domain-containing protein [unclassified Tenacibaculum]|uniref:DUF4271 domain-containing protein n=1 Tax=unclassified Tenacibaculum TaxID=2635139 RepID=UPI00351D7845